MLDSSSEIFSENNNDNESIRFLLNNKNKSNKATNILKGDRDFKNKNCYRFNIFQIFLFLIIFILQLAIYIYYYIRISLYKNVITYEYYISQYASNFITIFIGLREYIFDKKTMFLNNPIDEYMEYNLAKYICIVKRFFIIDSRILHEKKAAHLQPRDCRHSIF